MAKFFFFLNGINEENGFWGIFEGVPIVQLARNVLNLVKSSPINISTFYGDPNIAGCLVGFLLDHLLGPTKNKIFIQTYIYIHKYLYINKRLKYQFRLCAILSLKQNIYTYISIYMYVYLYIKYTHTHIHARMYVCVYYFF